MPAKRSEQPSAHDEEAGAPPRVLILVSHDFGELGLAWQFVEGTGLATSALMLLPPHLFQPNQDNLPCKGKSYRDLSEADSEVKKFVPDVILLCSGHLIVPNRIASCRELSRWLSSLRHRGHTIATTDPFLGFSSSIRLRDMTKEMVWNRPEEGIAGKLLALGAVPLIRYVAWSRLRRAARILFPLPVVSPIPKNSRGKRWYGFCPVKPSSRIAPENQTAPYWVFILSELDYQWQCRLSGTESVLAQLVKLTRETVERKRKPVLLIPQNCKNALESRMPREARDALITRTPYQQFVELICGAEHAFYWNMVSHSLLLRLRNNSPVHFLSRGHTAFMFPELHRRAMEIYYLGLEPTILDQADLPDNDDLLTNARQFNLNMAKQIQQMDALPDPDRLVSRLCGPSKAAGAEIE